MLELPPGPKSIGVIDFFRSAFVSPAPVFKRLAAEYGDTFRVPTEQGPVTFTGDPDVIRAVYTMEPGSFTMRAVEVASPVFGYSSVIVTAGEKHRRDRRLLTPPFNAGAMRAYGPAIAEAARAAAARWAPGRRFSMLESTQEIALDVIVRVVFGVEGENQARRMKAAVLGLIDALNPLILFFLWLRRDFGGIGPWARFQRAVTALDGLLLAQIQARRASEEVRPDILDLLVRARDEDGGGLADIELVEQLRALLFAGHETTATALASALFEIHSDPRILPRVVAEIDALGPNPEPDALASLPYLEAICYEALRMYPPVVDVGRVTRAPYALGRYTVPAGEAIVPSPIMVHSREDLYPEPERFKPERFLDWKPGPFEYIPFGGGARRCLGAAFAMYEMKVALGTVLSENRLRCAADTTTLEHIRRGLTMGPRGGVPMVLETRRRVRGATAAARKAEPSAGASGCPFAAGAGSS